MKKIIYSVLAAAMMTSLVVGCAKKPSEDEVRSAIESGTLTLEDAVEKGYVTDDWADAFTQERVVPASDKFSVNRMEAFTAEDVHGEEFSFTPGDMPVLFAFADPDAPESLAKIQTVADVYEEIKAAGGDVVLILTGETVPDALADSALPTIFYTDEIQKQLGSNTEMIDGKDFTASWVMKGSFITAWYGTLEAADLPKTAKDLLDSFTTPASELEQTQGTAIPAVEVN